MTDRGYVVWVTGLSGAGKSTIAGRLAETLKAASQRVEILDGDAVRENLSSDLGFSKEARDMNIRRIGYVARLLARNGVAVIVAAISPYRDVRDEVRRSIEAEGCGFVEVYARCSIDELARRDVKGLYKRALKGEIAGFTGVSDPYEEPLRPDVVIDSETETVHQSLAKITRLLAGPPCRIDIAAPAPPICVSFVGTPHTPAGTAYLHVLSVIGHPRTRRGSSTSTGSRWRKRTRARPRPMTASAAEITSTIRAVACPASLPWAREPRTSSRLPAFSMISMHISIATGLRRSITPVAPKANNTPLVARTVTVVSIVSSPSA
jgi:adenylylsulfate kinase